MRGICTGWSLGPVQLSLAPSDVVGGHLYQVEVPPGANEGFIFFMFTGRERGFDSGLYSRFNFGAGTKSLSSTWPEIPANAPTLLSRLVLPTGTIGGRPTAMLRQLLA
jgi:hypothetical protein